LSGTNVKIDVTWDEIERIVRIAAHPLRARIFASERARDLAREDVLQEGRLAVWLALERVPGSLPGYLVTRARGAMSAALRDASWVPRDLQSSEEQHQMIDAGSLGEDEQPLHPIQPCEAVASIHARRVLEQLQRLPDQQIMVAGMLAEGLDGAEIGRRLGVSTSRVSQIKAELQDWVRKRL